MAALSLVWGCCAGESRSDPCGNAAELLTLCSLLEFGDESSRHVRVRLVDRTDLINELRGATASQTCCRDHAVANIGIDAMRDEIAVHD
jgi:hypothetical protein